MSSQHISEELLLALKTNKPFELLVQNISAINRNSLDTELNNDQKKKAFWINVYNSYFLILRKHQNIDKTKIYTDKLINIAGQTMSLDDIEHGILRKYRIKKSLGYLPNWFAPRWIKHWAVDDLDYRIHFALNCGAVSCPPIAFYNSDRINQQLETATHSFLESEIKINDVEKNAEISKLFLWYLGDFGGKPGTRKIINKYIGKDISGYSITYSTYDFSEDLDNFV
jgi:hypothetical protein